MTLHGSDHEHECQHDSRRHSEMLFLKLGLFRSPSFAVVAPSPNLSAVAADNPNEVLAVHRHGEVGLATLESGGQSHDRIHFPCDSLVLASVDSTKCFLVLFAQDRKSTRLNSSHAN